MTGSAFLTCGIGPDRVTLRAGESRKVGLTLSSDPVAGGGWTRVSVVATTDDGRVQRGDVEVLPGQGFAPRAQPRSMVVAGCVGYVEGVRGPDQLQRFGEPIAGAWRSAIGPDGRFCSETRAGYEGSFELVIPAECAAPGETVFLSAGGLETCVRIPFEPGTRRHAVLLGRRGGGP